MVDVRTVRGVQLVKVGSWQPAAGPDEWTVTAADLTAAVEAHQAGVLRKPVVKIGHVNGGPALGYVDNLRTTDAGRTLLGDLVNVPAAVATLLPHAYPDRSVEALLDYQAPDGRSWPLVLTGLALLGAEAPAVETLQSLQGVGDLYGVPVAAKRVVLATSRGAGNRSRAVAVAVTVAAARRRRTHRIISQSKG